MGPRKILQRAPKIIGPTLGGFLSSGFVRCNHELRLILINN